MGAKMAEVSDLVKSMGPLTDIADFRSAKSLAAAICLRAVRDYILIKKMGGKTAHVECGRVISLDELTEFFKSDEFLLYSGGLNGSMVMRILDEKIDRGEADDILTFVQRGERDIEALGGK